EASDDRHHVGRRDRDVELVEALLDPFGQILAADDVGSGAFGLGDLRALREDGDLDVASDAVRQGDRSAQLLVGVTHVQAGANVHLDRLVELCVGEAAYERDRLGRLVLALAVDLAEILGIALAVRAHATSTPIERAVPAMIFAACSTSCAFRSASLRSAISRSCACE